MAQGDTPITIVGNLVADPELRFTPNGAAVANFTVASTPRRFNAQTNQWEDGDALFLQCNIWRQAASNVAETLRKGMRVIVSGRLRQRSYESQGQRRTVFEVEVDEVGPSLRYATAAVSRNERSNFDGGYNQGSASRGGYGGNSGGQYDNYRPPQGGSSGYQQPQQVPQNDPWNSAPTADFAADDDQPPF